MGKLKHERTCIICGKKYSYCSHCGEYDPDETWKYMYCSLNCKAIFKACSAFKFGEISADEAAKSLDNCDLSNKESFGDIFKENIDEIYGG